MMSNLRNDFNSKSKSKIDIKEVNMMNNKTCTHKYTIIIPSVVQKFKMKVVGCPEV